MHAQDARGRSAGEYAVRALELALSPSGATPSGALWLWVDLGADCSPTARLRAFDTSAAVWTETNAGCSALGLDETNAATVVFPSCRARFAVCAPSGTQLGVFVADASSCPLDNGTVLVDPAASNARDGQLRVSLTGPLRLLSASLAFFNGSTNCSSAAVPGYWTMRCHRKRTRGV